MNKSQNAQRTVSPNEIVIGILVNAVGGVVAFLLTELLMRLNLNPVLILFVAAVIVFSLLALFAIKTKRHSSFWLTAFAVMAVTIALLWSTTVRVPKVVGMTLTDAKTAVANSGLVFEEIEMVKGGSEKVVLQRPEPETRLFRNSRVKLFFGQRPSVTITIPKGGEEITSHRAKVEGISQGIVGARDFYIYVLIRPPNNHVWVQDPPILGPGGEFSVLAHFGTPDLGRGEKFRVQAIVTTERLRPGDYGLEVPSFVICTPILEISRSR